MTKTMRAICSSALRMVLGFFLVALAGMGSGASAQQQQRQLSIPESQLFANGKIEMLHVQGNVYMIAGAGANITVQVGSQYVFVVDAGLPEMSKDVIQAIRSVKTDKQGILFIIDTCVDQDHTGGNVNLSKEGWALPNSSLNPLQRRTMEDPGLTPQKGASILAHINVLNAMSQPGGNDPKIASEFWPTDVYETDYWRFYNDEGVFLYHAPNAHTDGDTYVFFRASDVISTGDIVNLLSYPVIGKGGSINGEIDALNHMIEIMEAKENEEGGTYIIPGHGHIGDRHDVVNYRDMVTVIRDRIRSLVNKGMTLEQVKAAKPTFEYDGIYGSTTGPWTTDMFIDAIYRDMSMLKKQKEQKVSGGLN
jgi:glyoxylase-like metal-dependent hydrolase (beta-lactamase superfamily II)